MKGGFGAVRGAPGTFPSHRSYVLINYQKFQASDASASVGGTL